MILPFTVPGSGSALTAPFRGGTFSSGGSSITGKETEAAPRRRSSVSRTSTRADAVPAAVPYRVASCPMPEDARDVSGPGIHFHRRSFGASASFTSAFIRTCSSRRKVSFSTVRRPCPCTHSCGRGPAGPRTVTATSYPVTSTASVFSARVSPPGLLASAFRTYFPASRGRKEYSVESAAFAPLRDAFPSRVHTTKAPSGSPGFAPAFAFTSSPTFGFGGMAVTVSSGPTTSISTCSDSPRVPFPSRATAQIRTVPGSEKTAFVRPSSDSGGEKETSVEGSNRKNRSPFFAPSADARSSTGIPAVTGPAGGLTLRSVTAASFFSSPAASAGPVVRFGSGTTRMLARMDRSCDMSPRANRAVSGSSSGMLSSARENFISDRKSRAASPLITRPFSTTRPPVTNRPSGDRLMLYDGPCTARYPS